MSRPAIRHLQLETLQTLCLPSAAIPADFPSDVRTVESFEGLVASPNNPQTMDEGVFSPGATSSFTFGSGISLTQPIPNPGQGSGGVAVGDWGQGDASFGIGANGAVLSAADVPDGNAYFFTDGISATTGPLGFTFANDVGAVGAYVTGDPGSNITLKTFNSAGTLLESISIPPVSRALWTAKNLSAFIGLKNPGIRRVELSGDFVVMDMLMTRPLSPPLPAIKQFAAGADAGRAATVNQYLPDGTLEYSLNAFPGFTGGVRVAEGDFNSDGIPDLVVGTGPGILAQVKVLDGSTHQPLMSKSVFEGFKGGTFVAVGDVTGDGTPDIVVTPDVRGGPRVLIIRGGDYQVVASFYGIDDKKFRGGARVAIGDLNGDGRADVAVSAGFGGGPRIAAYDGMTVTSGTPVKLFRDFFAFESVLRNGAYLAIGDVDGDGIGDLIAGAGPGGGPRVLTLSGADLVAGKGIASQTLTNFFGGDPKNRSGIRVSAKNLDNDLKADIVVGDGSGNGSRVTAYLGKNFAGSSAPAALSIGAFGSFMGGVYVG